ncbi:hypothetical protein D9619_010615 [Psilocybe cf. subviscida]|uniref:Uncharacterized protein n=1 Tax=Psilocybe cf. subviscida TaxID=2480587 RepID=A0A8H5EZV8_9AGAR|nr:hypothetical protein D9619_010615 [Psilocybe cf. subviscida]
MPGTEPLPIVVGPMTRRMEDLYEFMRRILKIMGGGSNSNSGARDFRMSAFARKGVSSNGAFLGRQYHRAQPRVPPCAGPTSAALEKEGYGVVDFTPPNVLEGLKVGYQLMFPDGGASRLAVPMLWRRYLHIGTSHPGGQLGPDGTGLAPAHLRLMYTRTVVEERADIVASNEYRWRTARWREEGLDFVITVPMTLTALEHRKSVEMSLIGGEYMFLFGVRAGCIPVTTIDPTLDALPVDFFPKQTSVIGALASPIKRIFQWLFGGASAFTAAPASATTNSLKHIGTRNVLAPTPSGPQPGVHNIRCGRNIRMGRDCQLASNSLEAALRRRCSKSCLFCAILPRIGVPAVGAEKLEFARFHGPPSHASDTNTMQQANRRAFIHNIPILAPAHLPVLILFRRHTPFYIAQSPETDAIKPSLNQDMTTWAIAEQHGTHEGPSTIAQCARNDAYARYALLQRRTIHTLDKQMPHREE